MNQHIETALIRTQTQSSGHREHSASLYMTSSFMFENAEQGRALFAKEESGNIYTRYGNPISMNLWKKCACLKGRRRASRCVWHVCDVLWPCWFVECGRSCAGFAQRFWHNAQNFDAGVATLGGFRIATEICTLPKRGPNWCNPIPASASSKHHQIRPSTSSIWSG